jgi:hypothetical protein
MSSISLSVGAFLNHSQYWTLTPCARWAKVITYNPMTMTISCTTKVVTLDGVQCRVWEGETERGIKVHCFIPRVAVREGQNVEQFETELSEQRAPSPAVEAIPLRLIL